MEQHNRNDNNANFNNSSSYNNPIISEYKNFIKKKEKEEKEKSTFRNSMRRGWKSVRKGFKVSYNFIGNFL